MKTIKISGLAVCFTVTILSLTACGQENKPNKKDIAKIDGKGFAVLELFTSEGCSSCPPADELLAKIQKEAQGKTVYLLAYHVDYWNRLGWKDVFSQADFSKRQGQYGNWLGSQIYTPQLVVNGKTEFVGSDESAIRDAIAVQLATEPVTVPTLQAHQDADGLKVHYQVKNATKDSRLLIAIVQKEAQSKVERGENAGHTLSHVQIVRKLQGESLSIGGNGNVTIVPPKDFNARNWEVLGLVQDQSNGKIKGGAKAELNDAATANR